MLDYGLQTFAMLPFFVCMCALPKQILYKNLYVRNLFRTFANV